MTTIFTGPAVNTYVAASLKSALKLYAKTGMKVNRAYTPSNMMAMASKITGKKFKARDYMGAVEALDAWLKENMQDETIWANIKTV